MPDFRQRDVETPHFAIPFKFGAPGSSAAFVNEQDTSEDIIDCIKAILAFPVGSRDDLPEFGRPDLIFREITTGFTQQVRQAVAEWERRADVDVELRQTFDDLMYQIIVKARGSDPG